MEIHELNKFSGTLGAGDFLAIDNGVDTSKMAMTDFIDAVAISQTGEAIAAWLDEHPEATTTVQDGSLTEPKFSSALKLKTIKDYFTPEMFGAKVDGVTDDTDAIQSAISQGNIVLFLHDNYLISDTILIPSNRFLYGNGCTIHASHDGKAFANEHFADNTTDESIVICGFVIDNALNQIRSAGKGNMIYLCGVNNAEISDCNIINSASDGIYIGSYNLAKLSQNIHIHDCSIDDFTRQGISVVCGKHVVIERCTIGDGANDINSYSIDLEPNVATDVINVEVKDCTCTYSINTYLSDSSAESHLKIENVDVSDNYSGNRSTVNISGHNILRVEISNCNITGNIYRGLTLYQCLVADVNNNIIQASSQDCLYLSEVLRGVVDNNTIKESASATYYGVNIVDSVIAMQNNTIESNYNGLTVRGTSTAKVINNYIDANTSGVLTENTSMSEIVNNNIVNCATYGIRLGSSANIISNNRIYGNSNSPTTRGITFSNSTDNIIIGNMMKYCTDGIKPAPTTGAVDNNVTL